MSINPCNNRLPLNNSINDNTIKETNVDIMQQCSFDVSNNIIPNELHSKIQEICSRKPNFSIIQHSAISIFCILQTQIFSSIGIMLDYPGHFEIFFKIGPSDKASSLFLKFQDAFDLFKNEGNNEKLLLFLMKLQKAFLELTKYFNNYFEAHSAAFWDSMIIDIEICLELIKLNNVPALEKTAIFYSTQPIRLDELQSKFCFAILNYRQVYIRLQVLEFFRVEFWRIQRIVKNDDLLIKLDNILMDFLKSNLQIPTIPFANLYKDLLSHYAKIIKCIVSQDPKLKSVLKDYTSSPQMFDICLGGVVPYDPYFVVQKLKMFEDFFPNITELMDEKIFEELGQLSILLKNLIPFLKFSNWERINKLLENKSKDKINTILYFELVNFSNDKNESKNIVSLALQDPLFKHIRSVFGEVNISTREISEIISKILKPSYDATFPVKNDAFILPSLYRAPSQAFPPTFIANKTTVSPDLKNIASIILFLHKENFITPFYPVFYAIINLMFPYLKLIFQNYDHINILGRFNVSYDELLMLFVESCKDFKNGDSIQLVTVIQEVTSKISLNETTLSIFLKVKLYFDKLIELLKFNNYAILLHPPKYFLANSSKQVEKPFASSLLYRDFIDLFFQIEATFTKNLNLCKNEVVISHCIKYSVYKLSFNLKSEYKSRLTGALLDCLKCFTKTIKFEKLNYEYSEILKLADDIKIVLDFHDKDQSTQLDLLIKVFLNKIVVLLSNIKLTIIEVQKIHHFFSNFFALTTTDNFLVILGAIESNCSDEELQQVINDQVNFFVQSHDSKMPTFSSENNTFNVMDTYLNHTILKTISLFEVLNQIGDVILYPQVINLQLIQNEYFRSLEVKHGPVVFPRTIKVERKNPSSPALENSDPLQSETLQEISLDSFDIEHVEELFELRIQIKYLRQMQKIKENFELNFQSLRSNVKYVSISNALENSFNHFNNILSVFYRLIHPSNHPLSTQFIHTLVIDTIRYGYLASEQILLALALNSNTVTDPLTAKKYVSHNLVTLFSYCKWSNTPSKDLKRWINRVNFGEIYVRNMSYLPTTKSSIKTLLAKVKIISQNESPKNIYDILSDILVYSQEVGALFYSVIGEFDHGNIPREKSKKSKANSKTKSVEVAKDFYHNFKNFIVTMLDTDVLDKFLFTTNLSSLEIEEKDSPQPPLKFLKPILLKMQKILDDKKIQNTFDNILTNLISHLSVEFGFNHIINPITAHIHLMNILLLDRMLVEEILVNLLKFNGLNVDIDDHDIWKMVESLGFNKIDFSEEEYYFLL